MSFEVQMKEALERFEPVKMERQDYSDEDMMDHDDDAKSTKENDEPRCDNLSDTSSEKIDSTSNLKKKLYEIDHSPKRKEFLDDLFSFMQKSGSPINRLPIMAKSVLDLYELYNLVVARGGLVDVINKKLWQEIIKGLHLPSSITSAAFTLRTQYMKYLYPYECEKLKLSSPSELQAAIDGNRREGRRSNYGGYGSEGIPQRNHSTSLALHAQMSPLSLVSAVAGGQAQSLVNGSAAHTPLPHHPHHPQHPQAALAQTAGMAPEFLEASVAEYVKQLQREMRRHTAGSPSPPPRSSPSRDPGYNMFEMSRMSSLWNMYTNSPMHAANLRYPSSTVSPPPSHSPPQPVASPEPQKEALDLGLRSSPASSTAGQSPQSTSGATSQNKRKRISADRLGSPERAPSKRRDDEEDQQVNPISSLPGTHIKISNRGDGRDKSLVVSMELNGVMYQGVLFAQTEGRNLATNNNETSKTSRNIVS